MEFDLDEGLYVFEITLGYKIADQDQMTVPFVLKADDIEEAEELVLEYLELIQLAGSFWVAEIVGPYDPNEYQHLVEEGEKEGWDRLEDYSAEDFLEILHSDEL
ncbi:MAG: hypothetical protein JSU72_10285 [Deltaproteobacteria bacterium]|nr:MAG: hypothetical protein JSU72_10285 [Deltaproteobacteria bacterium]